VSAEPLSDSHVLLKFRHPEVAHFGRPGQFVMIKAGTSSEPPLRRPVSIMDVDPVGEVFALFLKRVGPGTRALAELRRGDPALCLGPLGVPFTAPDAGSEALLVAGGYGIAPFVLFSKQLLTGGVRTRVFYGGRTAHDLLLRTPFEEQGIPLTLATEDGSLGSQGLVTAPLAAHLAGRSGAGLFACGPRPMLVAVARLAEERGLPAQVSLDPWMGCGLGTCLGCVVQIRRPGEERARYRCACTEGPVFDASTVVWPDLPGGSARRNPSEAGP